MRGDRPHPDPPRGALAQPRHRRRARRSAKRSARPEDCRDEAPRRPATGGARLVRSAAHADLRRVRGDRARGRQRRRVRLYPEWDRDRGGRLARRRRGARADERQGVRKGRGQRLDRRRPLQRGIRRLDPRRRGGSELLRHRHQPGRAHGQPACPRGAHELPLPDHHPALVRRRRRPQPGDSLRRGHRRLPRPAARRLRRARPDFLSALLEMGRGIFLAAAPQRARAASAASSSTGWRIISTRISPSPATSARRSSTSSRKLVRGADGPAVHRRPSARHCSNFAAATSSSTCSTTAAHCSGSRPAATSTPS